MDDWEELDERSLHLPGSKSESSAGKTLGEQMIEQREKEEFQGEDEDNDDEQQDLEAAPRPEPTPAEAQKQRGTRAQVAAQRKEKQEKAQQRKPDEQNTPLEDATAEKLRQQRLQEESDLQLAQDAFAGAGSVNLDTFVPKTEAEHEQLADLLHKRYLHSLKHSGHYPSLLQKLLRDACDEMTSTEVKEIENAVVVLRNEKVKAEKERESLKKKKGTAKNKRYLNAGASGGKAGGLEDVDITPLDVDEGFDDFM